MWEYVDSCINYRVQFWGIKAEVLSAILYAFQANDIEIPLPKRDINFRNGLLMHSVGTAE